MLKRTIVQRLSEIGEEVRETYEGQKVIIRSRSGSEVETTVERAYVTQPQHPGASPTVGFTIDPPVSGRRYFIVSEQSIVRWVPS